MVPASEAFSILLVLELFSFRDILFSSFNVVLFGSIFCKLRYVTYDHLHKTWCELLVKTSFFFVFFFSNKYHLGLNSALSIIEWSSIGEGMLNNG